MSSSIDNIPFFAKNIALHDIVCARQIGAELIFMELVKPSGHSTLRVLVRDPDKAQEIRGWLRERGCGSELSHIPKLIAVDVPPNVKYSALRALLDEREQAGLLEYEEAALAQK